MHVVVDFHLWKRALHGIAPEVFEVRDGDCSTCSTRTPRGATREGHGSRPDLHQGRHLHRRLTRRDTGQAPGAGPVRIGRL